MFSPDNLKEFILNNYPDVPPDLLHLLKKEGERRGYKDFISLYELCTIKNVTEHKLRTIFKRYPEIKWEGSFLDKILPERYFLRNDVRGFKYLEDIPEYFSNFNGINFHNKTQVDPRYQEMGVLRYINYDHMEPFLVESFSETIKTLSLTGESYLPWIFRVDLEKLELEELSLLGGYNSLTPPKTISSLAKLPTLKTLRCDYSTYSGFLGRVPNLKNLLLFNNHDRPGGIPDRVLSGFGELEELSLSSFNTSILSEVSYPKIKRLYVRGGFLSFEFVSKFQNLENLRIVGSSLGGGEKVYLPEKVKTLELTWIRLGESSNWKTIESEKLESLLLDLRNPPLVGKFLFEIQAPNLENLFLKEELEKNGLEVVKVLKKFKKLKRIYLHRDDKGLTHYIKNYFPNLKIKFHSLEYYQSAPTYGSFHPFTQRFFH